MISLKDNLLRPRSLRLEGASVCQLKCPACPTASGETGKSLGVGFLKFEDFRKLIDNNPHVSHVELSNWGEIFLNKDIGRIIRHAYRKNVALTAVNGANLNNVKEDVLEALAKYKFRKITCSIDGASQESYEKYRVKGNFDQVIENIRAINRYKKKYNSPFPQLKWQYVAFGHNEHEIEKAKAMARELGMEFYLKLSWADFFTDEFSPVRDEETVRKESRFGVASRREYRQKEGREYIATYCCTEMWRSPQVNFDGRLLGCSMNFWGDYGNAFEEGLEKSINNDAMRYARDMLQGKRGPKKGIPCTTCKVYKRMREDNAWITDDEKIGGHVVGRKYVYLENKVLGPRATAALARAARGIREGCEEFAFRLRKQGPAVTLLSAILPGFRRQGVRLTGRARRLELPFAEDKTRGWKSYPIFKGFTKDLSLLGCHASALSAGKIPHPPHSHADEEVLLLLSGGLDVILPEAEGSGRERRVRLQPGQMIYYPAGIFHTIESTGAEPANYVMFKWIAPETDSLAPMKFGVFDLYESLEKESCRKGFSPRLVFQNETKYLRKLHCHTTVLEPGAGYEPHKDDYDVAILLLDGEVETLGVRNKPFSAIFYPAGLPHGMKNPTDKPARYIVFEFHRKS